MDEFWAFVNFKAEGILFTYREILQGYGGSKYSFEKKYCDLG